MKTGHKITTRKFTKNLIIINQSINQSSGFFVWHPFHCHIIFIAMFRLQLTEMQQFSAVTVSLRSGFSRFF